MSALFDLTARRHESRVLGDWLRSNPGAVERAGLAVQNNTVVVKSSDREGLLSLFQSTPSPSGFAVTDRTAMLVSTVYACLSKISGAITQLPIHEYTMTPAGDRARVSPASPLWWMLNESPAPGEGWTAASWKEWIVRCVHLRGDQHTEILRSPTGAVVGLKPHHPDYSRARATAGGLVYDVVDRMTGRVYGVAADDMLHFSGFGFDGCRSVSCIQQAARTSIGNALAGADYMGRTMGEGAMPQIALTYPARLQPDSQKLLRESFVETYTGTGARKIPLILTEGGTAVPLSITPVDLELLESRRFEKEEICQACGVPPVLIGENAKTSSWGTGIEQITIGFVRFTIKPHLTRWNEELNRKLNRRAGRFLEFELDGLLAGDSKAQAEAFRAALGGPGSGDAWMTVDEVRKLKNLPAMGGDAAKLYRAPTKTTTPDSGAKP
jgi:HK97 family phage portal protein